MKYGKYNAGRMLPLAAFAAMAFATSCSNDSIADGGNQSADGKEGRTVELTATLNGDNSAATRVGMTKGADGTTASLYWHSKDAILVQTTTSDGKISGVQFNTDEAKDGDITAKFTGNLGEGETLGKYAVYPYSDSHSFSEDEEYNDKISLTYTLPGLYEYSSVKFYEVKSNVFSKTENGTTTYPTPCAIPMVGTVEDESNITFKHIGGLAVIRIDNMPFASGTMIVTSSTEKLSGAFTIEDLSADNPEITNTSTITSNADQQVSFSFTDATTGEAGVFYLPLATGDYTDIKIQLVDGGNDKVYELDYGKLSVARASVQAIALKYSNGSLAKDESSDDDGGDGTYTIAGYTFVDLGLPSGLIWATKNLGATTETEYGYYYAWGETSTKTDYSWDTYTYGTRLNITKYTPTDELTTLENEDDVAYVTSNGKFRMPTYEEAIELLQNCECTETTKDDVKGLNVTSKTEGKTDKSIFLPYGGQINGTSHTNASKDGSYWTKTLYTQTTLTTGEVALSFIPLVYPSDRYLGLSIRPVADKQN